MNQEEKSSKPLMVTIRCITYNHAPYIRQCLEGFVIQKTNFRFEAIVHDDASTDGTADIIREYAEKYPDIIKPIYETENQYSKHDGSLRRIMDAHMHGKYVALCEGDDYWIDPLKLQKQVDFLEANPEYGLVHTYFNYVDTQSRVIPPPETFYEKLQARVFDGYVWDYYLVNPGFILTCTCMFRRSLYRKEEQTFFDHGLFMMIARQSKVYCLREVTAAYRRNPEGAMLSHAQYYRRLCDRVRLHQLYYFMQNASSLSYYKRSLKAKSRVGIIYTHLIVSLVKGTLKRGDAYLLGRITLKKPALLLMIPFSVIAMIVRRLRRRFV